MSHPQSDQTLDSFSDSYRDSFRRINAVVIEGELEAHDNFICLARLLPEHAEA